MRENRTDLDALRGPDLDALRARALDRAERAERHFKLAIVAAALVEAVFLVALLWLADFSDRTHLVLLVATVMVYTMTAVGLVALGAHVNRVGLRILKGIGAIDPINPIGAPAARTP